MVDTRIRSGHLQGTQNLPLCTAAFVDWDTLAEDCFDPWSWQHDEVLILVHFVKDCSTIASDDCLELQILLKNYSTESILHVALLVIKDQMFVLTKVIFPRHWICNILTSSKLSLLKFFCILLNNLFPALTNQCHSKDIHWIQVFQNTNKDVSRKQVRFSSCSSRSRFWNVCCISGTWDFIPITIILKSNVDSDISVRYSPFHSLVFDILFSSSRGIRFPDHFWPYQSGHQAPFEQRS